ncbi:hypothetical protein ABIG04_004045 [Bradyrhizobium japonicum]
MDERETSAMTVASGLVTDPAGAAAPSGTKSSHPPCVNSGEFATEKKKTPTWRSGCARSP